jgi:tRNA threonylcarbamoyladenosine biosynthesis protein TsaE
MPESQVTLTTRGGDETRGLGAAVGRLLTAGDVVTLSGELGAGKTVFAQGAAAGLDVVEPVSSPTFTLVHEYRGRLPVWHLDVYRLRGPEDLADLGWEDLLAGGGVIVIEWPQRIEAALPEERLDVRLAYGEGDVREIELVPRGERMRRLVGALTMGVLE